MVIFDGLVGPLDRLQVLVFVVLLFEVGLLPILIHISRIHLLVVQVAVPEFINGQLMLIAIVLYRLTAVEILT